MQDAAQTTGHLHDGIRGQKDQEDEVQEGEGEGVRQEAVPGEPEHHQVALPKDDQADVLVAPKAALQEGRRSGDN